MISDNESSQDSSLYGKKESGNPVGKLLLLASPALEAAKLITFLLTSRGHAFKQDSLPLRLFARVTMLAKRMTKQAWNVRLESTLR